MLRNTLKALRVYINKTHVLSSAHVIFYILYAKIYKIPTFLYTISTLLTFMQHSV